MFERFTQDARAVVKAAEAQARSSGARRSRRSTCCSRSPTASAVIGLDHDEVLAALEAERDRSLAAVGIATSDFDLPPARSTRPRFAASSKLALERALRAAVARSDRRIAGGHILLGRARRRGRHGAACAGARGRGPR